MDPIRFDTLTAQASGAYNRNAAAAASDAARGAGDAFAQILDQQIATRQDQTDRAARSDPPSADERVQPDTADRPPQRSAKRRDQTSGTQATATHPTTAQAATAPANRPSSKSPAKAATPAKASDTPKPAANPAPTADATGKDGAVVSKKAPASTHTEDDPGAQQPGTAPKETAPDDGKGNAAPVAATLALTAAALPVADDGATDGHDPAATAANARLVAAQAALAATALPQGTTLAATQAATNGKTAAPGSQATATAGGLKFGAVLPDGAKAPTDGGAAAADPAKLDAEGDGQAATDPTLPAPEAGAVQAATARATAGPAKARAAAATAPNTVAASQAGKLAAAAVQPANAGTETAWPGTAGRPQVDALALGDGSLGDESPVTGDSEFSSWSQYLGSGSADGLTASASTRQAAFIAQLKQNLQIVPAHEQIAVQIQNAMKNGSSRLTVDLQPAELGRVEIKLEVDKDKNVSAHVTVDRPATLDLLQRDAKTLERALQDAGLQTGQNSLSFSLRDSGGQGGAYGQAGQGGGSAGPAGSGTAVTETAAQPARADVIATADGYVDLKT